MKSPYVVPEETGRRTPRNRAERENRRNHLFTPGVSHFHQTWDACGSGNGVHDVNLGDTDALVRTFIHSLKGNPMPERMDHLGPLAALLASNAGWRPDGLARVHGFLFELLENWAAEPTGSFYKGVSASDVRKAVGAYWGVDVYPSSARAAAEMIADSAAVSADSVEAWSKRIIAEQRLVARLIEQYDLPGVIETFPSIAAAVWPSDALSWPPPALWGLTSDPQLDEREVLIDASARLLGNDVAKRLGRVRLLQALRQSVADYVEEQYLSQRAACVEFRHFQFRVSRPWFRDDAAAARSPGVSVPVGRAGLKTERAIARITQMVMYEAAASRHALRGRLEEQVRLRSAVMIGQLLVEEREVADDHFRRASPRYVANVRKPSRSLEISRTPGAFDQLNGRPEPERALRLAGEIRRAPAALKAPLAKSYVQARVREGASGLAGEDATLMLLADQSVQLDLVGLQEADLARELSFAMRQIGSSSRAAAYSVLTWRNESLLDSKIHRHQSALHQLLQGYRELLVKHDDRVIEERKALIETSHQIALAATGIYIKLFESHLCTRRRGEEHSGLGKYAHALMWWSSQTSAHLMELDSGEHQPLARTRYEDGHISSEEWRNQTPIIRLRAMLGVHTAMESQLCRLEGPAAAYLFERSDILRAYLDVVALQNLPVELRTTVVNLSMWVASVNGGMVPFARELSPTLKDLAFLDRDPVYVGEGQSAETEFLMGEATAWLFSHNSDAGILHQFPVNGPVSQFLYQASAGSFASWHRAHFRAQL